MHWALFLAAAALAGATYPKPATVTAADGVRLAASMAVPAKATRGVVLVHQDGRAKEDWDALAKVLFGNGYAVLAIDLRTQGANAREGTPTAAADYAAMQTDVAAGIAHLKAQGVKTLALVGAELGANLVVNAAISDPSVSSLVLLSPGLDIRGIIASDAVPRYGNRPLLLIAAADDRAGTKAAAALDARAVGEHEFRLLERGGRGAQLLLRDPSLQGVIAGWIGARWEPSAPPGSVAPPRLSVP